MCVPVEFIYNIFIKIPWVTIDTLEASDNSPYHFHLQFPVECEVTKINLGGIHDRSYWEMCWDAVCPVSESVFGPLE